MKIGRGKVVAFTLTALGFLVLLFTVFLFKDRLVEEYWLWSLKTGDETERRAAIAKLGDVGMEKSLLRLTEILTQGTPCPIIQRSFRFLESGAVIFSPGVRPPGMEEIQTFGTASSAVNKIGERLGRERVIRASRNALQNRDLSLRARVFLAQELIIGSTPPAELPEPMKNHRQKAIADDPQADWTTFSSARPAAIDALVPALDSADEVCRAGAAFALSLCGPEAKAAVPALERAMADPVPDVSEAAAEALRKIRGE
jgi:hypothetical protein